MCFSCSWLRQLSVKQRSLELCGLAPMTFRTPPICGLEEATRKTDRSCGGKPVRGLTNWDEKCRGRQSSWVGFSTFPNSRSGMEGVTRIQLLCTHEHKPVLGADAQRISRPLYTAPVFERNMTLRTTLYLSYLFIYFKLQKT
jgi:hypothetical protein